jgi:cell wall-associated NlpC family hydrolase
MCRIPALWLAIIFAAVNATSVRAQGVEGQVGRFFEGPEWTVLRLTVARPLGHSLGLGFNGTYLDQIAGAGSFGGLGIDLTAFRGGRPGPYLVAGVLGGLGREDSQLSWRGWGSWSAGAGYELFPASFVSLGAEGRWRGLSLDGRNGFELAGGLAIRFGGRREPSSPPPRVTSVEPAGSPVLSTPAAAEPRSPTEIPAGRPSAARADSIIATATDEIGRKYQFGGTGEANEGFDCSGLIQYAYGQHGIALPRHSADQAREGRPVSKRLDQLARGDLLTFSDRGGPVTHVGMYIGDRLFIHSAGRGVQVSTLSVKDPYGRWWFKRWVGVRRILQPQGEVRSKK